VRHSVQSVIAGGSSEQRTIDKWRDAVFLFLVNLWAQEGSQCFSAKAV
jgi:hypothetical protein